MDSFAEIFDSTTAFLKSKGVFPEINKGKRATAKAIEKFNAQTGIALPGDFSAFFTDFADGFQFRWEKGEESFGIFSMPTLKQLAKDRLDWERNVKDFLEDPNSLNGCVREPFRVDAFQIWRNMLPWVPFWDEGNGDHFCLDVKTGRIVYDQHDWFDGFGALAKTNGITAGDNLSDFLQNWARFCFLPNKSLWWGEFSKYGAIKWDPQYFEEEFVRAD